jgi:DNA polymerase I-like protein with 3'-5' exonuclease and polymerase domains
MENNNMYTIVVWAPQELGALHTMLGVGNGSVYIEDTVDIGTTGIVFTPYHLLVCVGSGPLRHLYPTKLIPKNRTISTLRKGQYTYNGAEILFMYNPEDYRNDHMLKVQTLCDIHDVARFKHYGYLSTPLPHCVWAQDFTDLVDYCTTAPIDQRIVAFDTETCGGSPYNNGARILCISYAWKDNVQAVYVDKDGLPGHAHAQLVQLLTDSTCKVRFANGKYDLQWIQHLWGISCTNFTFDTLLGGNLIDENRSNSLTMHARVYTEYSHYDKIFNATYDKGDMEKVPLNDLLVYACGDALCCYLSSLKIVQELQDTHKKILHVRDQKITPYWQRIHGTPLHVYTKILHIASGTFEKIERTGVHIDKGALEQLSIDLEKEITAVCEQALTYTPEVLRRKYADNLSLTRASFLGEFLYDYLHVTPQKFTAKKGVPSTALKDIMDLLPYVPEHIVPFFHLVKEYTKLQKTKSTFVDGFLKHVCDDNKFHPTYFLFKGANDYGVQGGTTSGRSSTKGPSFHTLPKHTDSAKRLRACYTAPEGYTIVQGDLSQIEMRLIAYYSSDPVMLEAYATGKDLHRLTACSVHKYTVEEFTYLPVEEQIRLRQIAKSLNFGLMYGMGIKGYMEYAKMNYDMVFSYEQAKEYCTAYHATYAYVRRMHRLFINFARLYGFVITPFGRMHRLPFIQSTENMLRSKAERLAINRPVQSFANDLMVIYLNELDKQFPTIQLFGAVHDAFLAYVPTEEVETLVPQLQYVGEHLPLQEKFGCDLLTHVPLVVDMEIGMSLGDMHKLV